MASSDITVRVVDADQLARLLTEVTSLRERVEALEKRSAIAMDFPPSPLLGPSPSEAPVERRRRR